MCSSWPWCRTANISNSGLAFKWKWWPALLSASPSQLPLHHGFRVSSFVSTKFNEVFISTPQNIPGPTMSCLKPAQHTKTPTFTPPQSLQTAFPSPYLLQGEWGLLSSHWECSQSRFWRTGSTVGCPGTRPRDQGCEMGMAPGTAWVRHLELCPALTPGLGARLGCTYPAENLPVQDKPGVDTTALCGPGCALL